MKAKRKPMDKIELDSMGLDTANRLTTLEVEEPEGRAAGVIVNSVSELVEKAAQRSEGDLVMSNLVIVEHDNNEVAIATLNAVTAAQQIGGDIDLLVAGENCGAVAEAAAKIAGVSAVKVADNANFGHHLAENLATLIVEIASGYSHVLASATTFGKNVMPRAAALLDVAQISDIVEVKSADTFVRPIYAGNALATVQSSDSIKVITVRTIKFEAAASEGGSASVESISGGGDAGSFQLGVTSCFQHRPGRPGLSQDRSLRWSRYAVW